MSRAFRLALTLLFLASPLAHAQLFRTYLASDGNDANPCTLPQPCRLLPAALAAVAGGGQIWILDSANYNVATVAIAKSVSILAVPGAVASVVAAGGGPAFNLVANSITVGLRNLIIGPLAGGMPGTHGVLLSNFAVLSVEKCVIANMPMDAVFAPVGGFIRVSDSTLRNNGGYGVQLVASIAESFISVASTSIQDSGGGVFAWGQGTAVITGSVSDSILANAGFAIRTYTDSANAEARIAVTRSTIDRAVTALYANSNGTGISSIAISSNMFSNSGTTWVQLGAGTSILSQLNNHYSGSAGLNQGSITAMPPI